MPVTEDGAQGSAPPLTARRGMRRRIRGHHAGTSDLDRGGQVGRAHRVTLLGTGLIGDFYTMTLHGRRGLDRVEVAYSRSPERAAAFAERWGVPHHTTDLRAAVEHPDTDVVVVGLPNDLHEEAVSLVAEAGKAVFCTKPLARTGEEAGRILQGVGRGGGVARHPGGLWFTPKTVT